MNGSNRKPTVSCILRNAILLLAISAHFASPFAAESLDQTKIHSDYNDGDFNLVISGLEDFNSRNKSYSRDDSIFIAKHLAVVYAADPKTREKGRYYMFRLLELLPSAKIVDMFVSEEIDRIFGKVKEEFEIKRSTVKGSGKGRQPALGPLPPDPQPKPTKTPQEKSAVAKSSSAKYWIMGGVGTVGVGVGVAAYFLLAKPGSDPDKVYVLQKN